MAVTGDFRIPQQPAEGTGADALTGSLELVPLGGDGISAPLIMWEVAATLAHDASGGNATINVRFDNRFLSLVTLANMRKSSAAGAIECSWEMATRGPVEAPIFRAFQNAVPLNSLQSFNISVWNPPPLMNMDRLTVIVPNVTGDSMQLVATIYSFNINVLQRTPMYQILANLPRGGTLDASPN